MDLKFDTMEVNTKLAEDFIALHKAKLEQIDASESVNLKIDEFTKLNIPLWLQNCNDKRVQLKVLAEKFQENAELIAQLEVLKRGKVKEDVLNYDLKLIVANFKYWSSQSKPAHLTPLENLRIHVQEFQKRDYPLACLGYTAKEIYIGTNIELICGIDTLPLVYLFAILFHEAGLNSISLSRDDNDKATGFKDWNGCTAVIGEYADVDSAVDALLAATSHDPWRLHRIYVQESVYETVMNALSWKCTPKNPSSQAAGDKSKERDIYLKYGQKEFIFDYPVVQSYQGTNENTQTVFVEAYRTVKELFSLLQKDRSFCMSLWSSDVSESNEIALNVRTPVVWVNDYGDLDGAVHLSQAFYSNFNDDGVLCKCNEKVGKLRDNWSKLSTENRVAVITKALQKLESTSDDKNLKQEAYKLNEAIRQVAGNKSFDNTKGKMWINFNAPKGLILIKKSIIKNVCKLEEALKSVALGNILLYDEKDDYKSDLLLYLCNEDLPFIVPNTYPESTEKIVFEKVCSDFVYYRSRTIVIGYGTIFAN